MTATVQQADAKKVGGKRCKGLYVLSRSCLGPVVASGTMISPRKSCSWYSSSQETEGRSLSVLKMFGQHREYGRGMRTFPGNGRMM